MSKKIVIISPIYNERADVRTLAKNLKQVPIQFIDRSKIPKSTIFESFLLDPGLGLKYGKN